MALSARSVAGARLRLRAVAQFVRLSALGVTVFLPLLGAASSPAGVPLRWRPLLAILVVAVLFHVFAYVSNDVVDLPIDRTAPTRASSPLVRGAVPPGLALALALAQVPVIVLVAWWSAAGARAAGVMLAACCLMAVYNVWGKRGPLPPLTDLVQGLGWASLTLYGAIVGGGPGPVTGWVLLFVTVYVLMANGVHGSIRDLRNDHRHGVRSTAILLGARPGPGTAILLPGAVVRYVFTLQVLLAGLALAPLLRDDPGYAPAARVVTLALVAGLAGACHLLLGRALRAARDERSVRPAGILHLLATLALPITLLVGHLRLWMLTALLAGYIVPFLLNGWLPEALHWDRWHVARRAADLVVLTRLMSCTAAAGEALLGAHLAHGGLGVARRPVAVACVAVLLIAAAGNVANDLHDVPVDALNKPWRPLPSGRVSGRGARALGFGMAVAGVALAWTLGLEMGAVASGLAVLAVGYSAYLKGTVLLGNATVALVAASPILYGAQVNGGLSVAAGMAWSIVFLFMAALEVLKTVADRDADARVRLVTVATRFGVNRALQVVRGLLLLFALAALAPGPLGLAATGYTPAMLCTTIVPAIVAMAIVHRRHGEQPIRVALWVLRGAWFPGLLTLGLLR